MDQIISPLIEQWPGLAVAVIIVILFLRHLEKRDVIFIAAMDRITKEVQELRNEHTEHRKETSSGIAEMHRTVARRRKNARTRSTDKK